MTADAMDMLEPDKEMLALLASIYAAPVVMIVLPVPVIT
jgi:hypothetical protein